MLVTSIEAESNALTKKKKRKRSVEVRYHFFHDTYSSLLKQKDKTILEILVLSNSSI